MYKLQHEDIELLLKSINKPIILKDDWVLVNEKEYNIYKNKITITNADYLVSEQKIKEKGYKDYKDYTNKQVIINAESKNKYILIKYNSNFIAVNIADTEYGITINPMRLICARDINNLEEYKEIPSFEYLLYILDWKITNKALNKIKKQDNYF